MPGPELGPFLPLLSSHSVSPASSLTGQGNQWPPSRPASPWPMKAPRTLTCSLFGCGPCREAFIHIWPQGIGFQDWLSSHGASSSCPKHTVHHRRVLDPGLLGHISHRTLKDKQADRDGGWEQFGGAVGARFLAVVKGREEFSCETVNWKSRGRDSPVNGRGLASPFDAHGPPPLWTAPEEGRQCRGLSCPHGTDDSEQAAPGAP